MMDFLIPVTVNVLPSIDTLHGRQGMFILPDGSININTKSGTWFTINKRSDHRGVIKSDTVITPVQGEGIWFWASEGVYPYAGNVSIAKFGIISYNGNTWASMEVELPESKAFIPAFVDSIFPLSGDVQVTYLDRYWQLREGKVATSTDIPSDESLVWKSMGSLLVSPTFEPTSEIKPQGGKQISNFLVDMDLVEKNTSEISQIKPTPFMKYEVNDVLDKRSYYAWYKGVLPKKINRIKIPITSRYDGSVPLTDSVFFRLGLNGSFIFSTEITLAQMNDQNIDTQTGLEADSMYEIKLPDFNINYGDAIFIGVSCKSPTDALGFVATNQLSSEWINGYNYIDDNNVMDLTFPHNYPSTNGSFAYNIYFYNYTEIFSKKENSITKNYFSKDLSRQNIGVFLRKLRDNKDSTIVCYGDSITQFQNSETLTIENQRINPLGLSGESWVRQLWKLLQYKDADIQYRRFDHADFTFSNGIQETSAPIGSYGWASARNDAEAFRAIDFNGVYAQTILPNFTYNKPSLVTNKAGESFTIQIPSFATECEIILSTLATTTVNVKITSAINADVIINPNLDVPSENTLKYKFSEGSTKTLTVTNVNASVLAVWGIVYKSKPSVRVVNSGSGGYNISLLREQWRTDRQIKWYNPDLIVCEVSSSNDANLSISLKQHNEYVRELFGRFKEIGVPVLVILTHRFETQKINRLETSEIDQNSVKFVPELINNYKANAYEKGFAIIDVFSKSVDILGNNNTVTLPPNFFVDAGHLGVEGNKMYVDELKKLFLTQDFE